MSRNEIFLAAIGCFLLAVPARADDPASVNSPVANDSVAPASIAPEPIASVPVLDAPNPILRPIPQQEGTAVAESNPTPATGAPDTQVSSSPSVAAPAMPPSEPPSAPAASSPPAPASSPNVTINLLNLMVKRNLITKEDAADLIKQAQQEAVSAQQTAVAQTAAAQASGSSTAASTPSAPTPATSADADDDTVRVAYVPENVKEQIRDEVKDDVLKQAHDEHWTSADTTPDWVHRFHVTGDIRTRYEGDFFPDGNAVGSNSTWNFNSINTGSPLNVVASPFVPPTYNVDQNRNRFRLRARIGAGIDLGENFTAGMRLGTGSDDQPVSENQTLGGTTAGTQGGNFSKYQIWLDRAFIRYELGAQPEKDFSVSIGRFDNPFFSTSMIWADDIAFDGFMARGKYQIADGVTPFAVAGAFPIFNTDLNFGTGSTPDGEGYKSEDKWLYAVQGGATWTINKDFTFKGAVAYYDFENIQGQISAPIDQNAFLTDPGLQGSTDDSRPSFAQHGNTYIALRNIIPDTPPAGQTAVEPQYFGLASKFQELALTGQLDYSHFDPFHMSLVGEFVDNLAFDRSAIESEGPAITPGPINNLDGTGSGASYQGGGMGYDVRLNLGAPALEKLWDWNVNVAYRYLQSDAVVDAFNDADFGGYLTGTNLKGYILGANLGLSSRVWSSFRFMSADSIAGPPLKVNTVQVDLNAKF